MSPGHAFSICHTVLSQSQARPVLIDRQPSISGILRLSPHSSDLCQRATNQAIWIDAHTFWPWSSQSASAQGSGWPQAYLWQSRDTPCSAWAPPETNHPEVYLPCREHSQSNLTASLSIRLRSLMISSSESGIGSLGGGDRLHTERFLVLWAPSKYQSTGLRAVSSSNRNTKKLPLSEFFFPYPQRQLPDRAS